jgi:hypothetical protein
MSLLDRFPRALAIPIAWTVAAHSAAAADNPALRPASVPLKWVMIEDPFWSPNLRRGIPRRFLLIEPFWRAGIARKVTRNGSKPLALTGIWGTWG